MVRVVCRIVVCVTAVLLVGGCGTFSQSFKNVLNDSRVIIPELNDPVARLRLKQRLVSVDDLVLLDAGGSESIRNKPLSYRWYLVEKPAGSHVILNEQQGSQTELRIDTSGRYQVRVVVNDGEFDSRPYDALISTERSDLDRVRFVAIGDAGTGAKPQEYVAEAMAQVCVQRGCDFVVSAGDNIYKKGPSSVNDEQFQSKFERPYANLKLPFFMVLGNHDNTGLIAGDGGFNARGTIEVEYHQYSQRWTMPERYYRITAPLKGEKVRDDPSRNRQPLVEFFALDSTPLTSAPDMLPAYKIKHYTSNQARWIDAGLHNSRAQWRIALAHHPYISNGFHGNAGDYDRIASKTDWLALLLPNLNKKLFQRVSGTYFKAFFEESLCNKLDLYISGHDHTLQWLKPTEDCGKTEFIVTGAAAKFKPLDNLQRNAVYQQLNNKLGFFWVEIVANQMNVTIYTVDAAGGGYQPAFKRSITHAGY